MKLSTESFLEQLHLLRISIHVVTSILCQIVELLTVLIDTTKSLLQVPELLVLVAHKTCRNVVTVECLAEFIPRD
jgi:hypothetical protein